MHLEEYDPAWAERFAVEAGRLRAALAPWLAPEGVEHIGSTAVPGLRAKPIVDMLAAVRSLTEAREAFPALEALGYRHRPHRPEAHLFVRDGYGVHLTEPGSDLWRERLAFRDALRGSAELRAEYAAWKEEHFVGGERNYDGDKWPLVQRVLAERGVPLKQDDERLEPAVVARRAATSPLLHALAELEFPLRYYALCERHPLDVENRYRATRSDVEAVLGRLGESATYDKRDRSFSSTEEIGEGEVQLVFVAQSRGSSAELLIAHSEPAGTDGSNFAGLARRITELEGGEVPHPPYPRPELSSPESLAEVLTFGFRILHDVAEALRR